MTYETGSADDLAVPRTRALGIVAAVLALMLSGCAGVLPVNQGTDPGAASRSLDDAKTDFIGTLDEILAQVDDGEIAELRPQETTSGTLFECGPPDQYYWPGGRSAVLSTSADPAAIVSRIETTYTGREGWSVSRLSDRDRDPIPLRLQHDDGTMITVSIFADGTELDLNGFSSCFTLPDYDPLERY